MPSAGAGRMTRSLLIAWGGAAAFLISLLSGAYAYLFRFDSPGAGMSLAPAVTYNVALFSVFALHHSVLARVNAKQWVSRQAPPELERSLYTWVASLLFIAVCAMWQPVPGTLYRADSPWRMAGYAVQLAGVILTIRSASALGFLDLAGVDQVRKAKAHAPAVHVPLETRGVYAFVRHPLYFAWALMVFGTPDMTATRFTFALVSTGYLAIAIPWEERSLVGVFGAAYEEYRQRVRWRMLPGVY